MKAPKGKSLSGKKIVSAPTEGDRGLSAIGNTRLRQWILARLPDSLDASVESAPATPIPTLQPVATGVIESPDDRVADAEIPSSGRRERTLGRSVTRERVRRPINN